ncbi:MAG: hypothetical protein HOA08_05880 [Rhodospirillaceae bacterium]|nr:hypothetical protein [Rhodospirillaceae bacterium]MBT3494228.1 hypothetical protein [Rhodospirillaceae bacterium]MBT3979231.1 hypothetical protein [Rhodospirillaceae bacterium]MBT4169915.1 hypothetical protein [Rhodospirillaceae bacterium]MBT4564378.1 hypothetical protein [Rhodospirillaceae bacterium]
MRNGIAISTLLHFGVVLAAVYGLPDLLNPPVVVEQPIIVELVTIAERTVSQKPVEPQPKKPPPPAPKLKPIAAPEPKPEPAVAKAPPPPPPPPEPAKVEAPAPPKPAPKAKPAEVVTPKPKPAEKPKPKAQKKPAPPKKIAMAEPPKAFRSLPRPKQKPKRRRPKFSADRIAALLDKDERKHRAEQQTKATKKRTAAKPPPTSRPSPSRVRTQPMTMSEIDAIRYQIQQCWTIPAGARDARNLVVRIKVFLNPDGSLAKAPEIVGGKQNSDPFYRTAAESARRAVQKCAPLKNLPADKYARWRELTLTFNPRDMLGG